MTLLCLLAAYVVNCVTTDPVWKKVLLLVILGIAIAVFVICGGFPCGGAPLALHGKLFGFADGALPSQLTSYFTQND